MDGFSEGSNEAKKIGSENMGKFTRTISNLAGIDDNLSNRGIDEDEAEVENEEEKEEILYELKEKQESLTTFKVARKATRDSFIYVWITQVVLATLLLEETVLNKET